MPYPNIGNPLRIRAMRNSEEFYRSRLVEVTEVDYYIEVPLHHRSHVPLMLSERSAFWVEFNAPDGSLCKFEALRKDMVNLPVHTWRIDKPPLSQILREQRREFVRVTADLPVRVSIQGRSTPPLECLTRDVSGGGLGIVIPKSLHLTTGQVIEAKFTLPKGNFPVNAKCFVIRVSEPNDSGYRIASVEFIDMNESIRQRIIQFTFTRQRMLT